MPAKPGRCMTCDPPENDYDGMTRKMIQRMATVKAKFDLDVEEEAETRDESSYWRDFETTCTMCGDVNIRNRGYIFVGMAPEGEMKIFCNVDCCEAWEKEGDNTNARRAAIEAQKARKKDGRH